ncbi:hypothetical protein HA466_0148770 [Hirschfeldia incana]|nr:hypothetical protein HA466_0148770 [Hirschfeldia incana]
MNSGADILSKLALCFSSFDVFFRRASGDDGVFCYCWATVFALVFISLCQILRKVRFFSHASSPSSPAVSVSQSPRSSESRISTLVSDEDLKDLIEKLGERSEDGEIWEDVIQKSNPRVSYTAKCCKPQDGGPIKYLSTTVFENCSPEVLRDFYMDNEYRKQWDKTVVEHEQLQVDSSSGIEIGRTIKKFPLLTPREYVLAWRLWEGKDKFYCFIKCDHSMVPQQRKYVRVSYFRSGWRIRKVPGRDACEIHMFHQEDAGLNVEMAKLAFSRGIWSYVCKMDSALRKYIATSHRPQGPTVSAVSLMQKIPPEVENQTDDIANSSGTIITGEGAKRKKLLRKPSKKQVAKGLLLVGGAVGSAVCLSRGHSALGAKVALAYFLTKLRKRGAQQSQTSQNAGI